MARELLKRRPEGGEVEIDTADAGFLEIFNPGADSQEMKYLHARRKGPVGDTDETEDDAAVLLREDRGPDS